MRRKRAGPRGHGGSRLRAAWRSAILVLFTVILALVQSALYVLKLPAARRFPMHWHRLCRHAAGLGVRRFGIPETRAPVLYVANHASYLDVAILGSLLEASFVAKAEVARWPFFGFLCRLQRTVFIDRQAASVQSHLAALQGRLAAGDNIVLFPEGTSSDGNRVLPFKAALFRAAAAACRGHAVRVQPVAIVYSRFNGLPMGRRMRPFFAWYGDMTFPSHFWTCLGMGRPEADVVFHPSVELADFASHAQLAKYCEARIAGTFSEALSGRLKDADHREKPAKEETGIETALSYSL
jgi:1-acyl-sn-glycerol-3-phosphate acyltransferase